MSDAAEALLDRIARAAVDALGKRLSLPADPAGWNGIQRMRFRSLARGEGILQVALRDPRLDGLEGREDPLGETRRATLWLLADAKTLSRRLAEAGVPHRFAYGLPLLRLYPDAGLRPLSDVDLWIPPALHSRAERAILAHGFERAPHGDDVFRKPPPAPGNLDLLGRLAPLDAFPPGEPRNRDGVPGLPPTEELLTLLCRALLRHGRLRWVWIADLALLVDAEAIDPERLDLASRRLRLGPLLSHAESRLRPLVGARAEVLRPRRRARLRTAERWIASAWERGGLRGTGSLAEAYWLGLPAHALSRGILRALFPGRDFLRRRYGARGAWLLLARILRPFRLAAQAARAARLHISRRVP